MRKLVSQSYEHPVAAAAQLSWQKVTLKVWILHFVHDAEQDY